MSSHSKLQRALVILLDELSLGLVPLLIEGIFGMVKRLRDERNLTVVLVEQNGALALDMSDHSYVMKTAALCWRAGPETFRENSDIRSELP
jgi:branched-chain amino acid transport system ATP-binding protein